MPLLLSVGCNRNHRFLLLLMIFGMSLVSKATADKIGINFVGGAQEKGTPAPIKSSEFAGAFPQKFWNNSYEANGTLSPVGDDEKGSSASYPDFIVSWAAPKIDTNPIARVHGTPDYRLGRGYLEAVAGQTVTITFTNIPDRFVSHGRSFSIMVYFFLDNIDFKNRASSDKVNVFTLRGAKTEKTICGLQPSGEKQSLASWVKVPENSISDAHENTPAGNYVAFSHLTDTDLILTAKGGFATDGNPQAAINAIQIIPQDSRRENILLRDEPKVIDLD